MPLPTYKAAGITTIPIVMATLVQESTPEPDTATESKTPQKPATSSDLKYIFVAQNSYASYFLRNDGKIDRSTGGGKIDQRMTCAEPKVWYVWVCVGVTVMYAIRSDGKVDRSTGSGKVSATIECPDANVKFVAGSGADTNTYLIGDNGNIYRFRSATDITPMPCTAGNGITWVTASGGINTSYFVRSDGRIEYTQGSGKLEGPIEAQNDTTGKGYVGISSQLRVDRGSKGEDYSNMANYFIRADGSIDRTTGPQMIGKMRFDNIVAPSGLSYLAAAAGSDSSYYLRSDGAVDRTTGSHGKVNSTMNPPPGTTYTQAATGNGHTYILRSDGLCDRTSGGQVKLTMQANNDPLKKASSCSVM